jgi:hypothetical protein
VYEQAFEHDLDVARLAEHSLDARPAAAGPHDREVTRP